MYFPGFPSLVSCRPRKVERNEASTCIRMLLRKTSIEFTDYFFCHLSARTKTNHYVVFHLNTFVFIGFSCCKAYSNSTSARKCEAYCRPHQKMGLTFRDGALGLTENGPHRHHIAYMWGLHVRPTVTHDIWRKKALTKNSVIFLSDCCMYVYRYTWNNPIF